MKKRNNDDIKQDILASKNLARYNFEIECLNLSVIWFRAAHLATDLPNPTRHRHKFFELHYCTAGECGFTVEDTDFYLTAGKFLLISPGYNHILRNYTNDFSKFVLGFKIDEVNLKPEAEFIVCALTEYNYIMSTGDEYMASLLRQALIEGVEPKPGLMLSVSAILQLFVTEVARKINPPNFHYNINTRHNDREHMLQIVENYIEYNVGKDLDVLAIAKEVNISVKQLNRIALKYRMKTIRALIDEMKLKEARRLLENTDDSLLEIAGKLGYSSEYSFNRFFKRVEGMPPGRYRRDVKQY